MSSGLVMAMNMRKFFFLSTEIFAVNTDIRYNKGHFSKLYTDPRTLIVAFFKLNHESPFHRTLMNNF